MECHYLSSVALFSLFHKWLYLGANNMLERGIPDEVQIKLEDVFMINCEGPGSKYLKMILKKWNLTAKIIFKGISHACASHYNPGMSDFMYIHTWSTVWQAFVSDNKRKGLINKYLLLLFITTYRQP